jgi:hypothetical protein
VTVRTQTETVRVWPLNEVAALLISRTGTGATLAPGAAPHTLRLRDGRTYRGELDIRGEKSAAGLTFRSVSVGEFTVSLEETSAVELSTDARPRSAVTQDTLQFRNGDRATGFVESVGSTVRISGTDGERIFEIESISAIDFANPPTQARGFTVRTADEIISCDGLSMPMSGPISILRGAAEASDAPKMELQSLLSIVPESGDVMSLSDLAITSHDRSTSPPQLLMRGAVGRDLEVTGPATVTWTLPTNATKIAGELTLPENCRDWGDLNYTLTVNDSTGERARTSGRLNGQAHTVEFALPVSPGTAMFTLKIESGEGGPIHDRVRLSRTLIALESTVRTP